MVTEEKIANVLDYYDVKAKVESVFGDWVVTSNGDIINVEFMYPIYSYQLKDDGFEDWNEHLQEKTWYDACTEKNFKQAYALALAISKK